MFKLFTQTIQGPWVAVLALAAVLWPTWAFGLTGLWQALGAAQSGVPGESFWLQQTPLFTPEQAQAAFANMRAAGAEGVALSIYALDLVFVVLAAAAAGAGVGFGLRRLGWEDSWATLLLIAPIAFFVADMTETLILLFTVATGQDGSSPLLSLAGVATAIKTPSLLAATALEAAGLLVGSAVWLVGRLRAGSAAANGA